MNKKKVLLFYNGYAGNGVIRNNLDIIIDKTQSAGFQLIPVKASETVTIETVLEEMDPAEYDRIIVAGGDGTISYCANAIVKNDIHLPVALLPAGTANDFAYYFHLPSDIEYLMDVAMGDKTTKADIGCVNGKCFVNVAAMGAMVDVSQKTDPHMKNALGTLAYYLKALSELPQVRALPFKLTTPERTYNEELFFLVILNGESAGGLRKLSPSSSVEDGKLDVIAFRKMPIVELAPLFAEVLSGRHRENKNVLYFQTSELTVESDVRIATDIDGERGAELPLHFSVLEKRLELFVPEEYWSFAHEL